MSRGSKQQRQYFAACSLGLEPVLTAELEALGASEVRPARGGAHFSGDLRLGYAACLWLRTGIRVQEEVHRGRAVTKDALYREVREIDWSHYMDVDQTLAVHASIKDSFAADPRTPALVTKDAIVDQFRERFGRRPSVDREAPTLPLRVVLRRNELLIYRDLAGESLHKRGYRPVQVKSPLNECLAAGLLLLAGWDGKTPLYDPFCGSGTMLIEAAWLAGDRAPGLGRAFPFDLWPDFDGEAWEELVTEADDRERAGRKRLPVLCGSDHHRGALGIAKDCVHRAGLAGKISLVECSIEEASWSEGGVVMSNPPYGERLGRGDDLIESWRAFGTFLHDRCNAKHAYVLTGNTKLAQHLRLRIDRRWPVRNGPLECRLLGFRLFGDGDSSSDAR